MKRLGYVLAGACGLSMMGLALLSGCEAEVSGPGPVAVVAPAPPPPPFPMVEIVGEDGYHHRGYWDEHHYWHGGYYDRDHHFHDDARDWHH